MKLEKAVSHAVNAKNLQINKTGFSPRQLMYGKYWMETLPLWSQYVNQIVLEKRLITGRKPKISIEK